MWVRSGALRKWTTYFECQHRRLQLHQCTKTPEHICPTINAAPHCCAWEGSGRWTKFLGPYPSLWRPEWSAWLLVSPWHNIGYGEHMGSKSTKWNISSFPLSVAPPFKYFLFKSHWKKLYVLEATSFAYLASKYVRFQNKLYNIILVALRSMFSVKIPIFQLLHNI